MHRKSLLVALNQSCFVCMLVAALGCNKSSDTGSRLFSPGEAVADFKVPAGFCVDLIAAEPMVEAPVALAFDDQADCWVVEMRGYMPDENGIGEEKPCGRIKILRDRNSDGLPDQTIVFLDSLVLPRAVCPVYDGVLVAEPPCLWFYERRGDRPGKRTLVDSLFAEGHNPEHQANGLTPAMDNWIYAARCEKRYRREKNGLWRVEKSRFRGQWGLSQDDYGRLYYNDNSTVLTGDDWEASAFPLNALKLSEKLRKAYGRQLASNRVYPRLPTPGVNRGYESGVLDSTGRLAKATATCGPVVFRGDNFSAKDLVPGKDDRFLAFVEEPAAQLIKCVVLSDSAQHIIGEAFPSGSEFLTSSDERFRPVNCYNAPDGSLWVLDFHRGLIQHSTYLTPYLRDQVAERKLAQPTQMGRIFRIRKSGTPPRAAKPLSGLSNTDLMAQLAQPNGWRRDKAQWLLVQRGDTSVVPALIQMACQHPDSRARLHALWTLEGMEVQQTGLANQLFDANPEGPCARAALRLSAPKDWASFKALYARAGNQHALSFAALAPVFLSINTVETQEMLLDLSRQAASDTLCIAVLAGAIWEHSDSAQIAAIRTFLLKNGVSKRFFLLNYLQKDPNHLDELPSNLANLSRPDRELYKEGRGYFETYCASCHGKNGGGLPNLAPPLAGSEWAAAPDKSIPIRILLDGLEGPLSVAGQDYALPGVMPGLRQNVTTNNGVIAKIATYIRNSWGNQADPVQVSEVALWRAKTEGRKGPYRREELR